MIDLSRRRLLQAAASGLALCSLPGAARPEQPRTPAKLSDIDHIVILMKENRSFDHYFGSLSGVRGYADQSAMTLASGRSVFHQPDPLREEGYLLPFRLDTARTSAQNLKPLDHSWSGLHAAWNSGAMDNWVLSRRRVNGALAPLTMGYYTREDLPFYYALADAFTICDGYFASMMGPTHPNRCFLWTGSIDSNGRNGGPALDNSGRGYTWETYPERLQQAGISWRIYHQSDEYGCNQCRYFASYHDAPSTSPLHENALRDRTMNELLKDIRTGNLPQVTWIVAPSTASEHPNYLVAAGEDFTRVILQELWANRALWAKTLFVLNYDENDGQFDHVAPPVPEPGTRGEFVGDMPIGLGFRVPCILVSPFTRGGYVCSETFDHTSTLRLIETRFGVEVPNLSAWRRSTCGDLTAALGLGVPAESSLPDFPVTAPHLLEVERDLGSLPEPLAPVRQQLPVQEAGVRPRRGSASV